jgi:long-chain acyl-CoA synthetase
MMSHGNLITSITALVTRFGTINEPRDTYIAYLPLAHVLELVCEITCLLNGIALAYSSPQTITDTATAIKRGQKGDLRTLKPTIMAAVPIVLERLSKTVYEKISSTNWRLQMVFKMAYVQKLEAFRAGRSSRLLDRILFKSISRAVLGGKCRLMLSGGAILSKEVHEFMQVCLCPVMQAYGLTETCGAATTQLPNQTDTEIVGSVVPCCEIKLVDWPEGGL